MIRKLLPLLLLLMVYSCQNSIDRNLPQNDEDIIDIDLGGFLLQQDARQQSPYYFRNTIVFKNSQGQEQPFIMLQPLYTEQFRAQDIYPDPEGIANGVNYKYTVERYAYEFTCGPCGAKLLVEFVPALCNDPMLKTEDVVADHIRISGFSFFDPNLRPPNPILDVDVSNNVFCEKTERSQYFQNITIGGKEYQDVYFGAVPFAGTWIEVHYSKEYGIIAYKDKNVDLVLDRLE